MLLSLPMCLSATRPRTFYGHEAMRKIKRFCWAPCRQFHLTGMPVGLWNCMSTSSSSIRSPFLDRHVTTRDGSASSNWLAGWLVPTTVSDAWASAAGVESGPLRRRTDKADMIHELDAVVAHLYGLTEAQLRHVFETFHEGWDYHHRLDGVVRHFRAWAAR